ncbi:fasciclin domain-containing protein [Aquamicrobium sp. NLF2-7]|uniref:fasciclin domain-containing protein n=1 Tax=Aquamicrobium sp. NLF2-7 TaxID=2918753 RepID=UPI001EFA4083|nr:fasciclin domain-containing protein [Aquamicrobium sp. NLF2-7]
MADDIADGTTQVETLNPDARLTVTKDASGVKVSSSNTANVVMADVAADNGVIHVIDAVLLP